MMRFYPLCRATHLAVLVAVLVLALATVLQPVPHARGQVAALPEIVVLDGSLMTDLAGLDVMRGADIGPAALQGKFVVVSFFASWCAPCRAEFIELGSLIEEMGPDRLKVVTINWLEDFTRYPQASLAIYRVLDRLDPHITAVAGTEDISRRFGGADGIRAIPTLFAFDPSGAQVFRFQRGSAAGKTHTQAADLRAAFR